MPLRAVLLVLLIVLLSVGREVGSTEKPLASVPVRVEPRIHDVNSTDQDFDTLRQDDGRPLYAFRFPDAYGDDWRNQRFRAPQNCALVGVMVAFPTRHGEVWTTGDPALLVRAWPSGSDSLPVADTVWFTDTTEYAEYAPSVFDLDSVWRGSASQFVAVDLSSHGITLAGNQEFHLGYSARRDSPEDSLAILADDGSPPTNYASEWYRGRFVFLRDGWGGVNLFIRAVVDYGAGDLHVLHSGKVAEDFAVVAVYPNPFNAVTTIRLTMHQSARVRLVVYDVLGRERQRMMDSSLAPGLYELALSAADWGSGTYFIHVTSGEHQRTLPIVLEK